MTLSLDSLSDELRERAEFLEAEYKRHQFWRKRTNSGLMRREIRKIHQAADIAEQLHWINQSHQDIAEDSDHDTN